MKTFHTIMAIWFVVVLVQPATADQKQMLRGRNAAAGKLRAGRSFG